MLERPKYQPFVGSVVVAELLEYPQAGAGEGTTLAPPVQDMVPCAGWEKSTKGGEGVTDKTAKTPLATEIPCAVCGGVVRWNDHGVQRCRTCSPDPLTRKTRAAERAEQARRIRR